MTYTRSPFADLSTEVVHEIAQHLLTCEDALSEAAAGQTFVPAGPMQALLQVWTDLPKPAPLAAVYVELMQRMVGAGSTPRVCVLVEPIEALLTATRLALPPGWRTYYHHRGNA